MLTGAMTEGVIWKQRSEGFIGNFSKAPSCSSFNFFGLQTLENSFSLALFCVTFAFHLLQDMSNCEENGKR